MITSSRKYIIAILLLGAFLSSNSYATEEQTGNYNLVNQATIDNFWDIKQEDMSRV
tara:strand:- start:642 stop:809 length:168 start_codon:yes stop_codon:yes gene_type:complete